MGLLIRYFILINLFVCQSFGATDISKIKDSISQKRSKILGLQNSIKSIERKARKNSSWQVSLIERKRDLEIKVYELRNKISLLEDQSEQDMYELKRSLAKLLLSQVKSDNKGSSFERLAYQKVMKSKITNLIQKSKTHEEQTSKLSVELSRFEKEVLGISRKESEIGFILFQLEQKKDKDAKAYLEERSELSNLNKRLSKLNSSQSRRKKMTGPANFLRPIKYYSKFQKNRNWISFYSKKKQNVYSSASGIIEHVGQLSTYGTVVIIKHEGRKRSVIQAKMDVSVKAGDKVKKGDILGHIQASRGQYKLEFGLRRDHKSLNSVALLKLRK